MSREKNENLSPHDHGHFEKNADIISHMPDTDVITSVSEAMKQLGDPSRLKIFWLLCHCEECVADIAGLVGMSSPAVSHHLRLLKDSGLITSRRDGKEMLYRASDDNLTQKLHHTIEEVAKISCPR